jgi:ABC-type transport system involved in multi-copper enzyme maturation permease subunit
MYNGVEIEHPVFRVLFCNLIVSFISSAVNIIAYPIEKNIKYSTIINGNNYFCLLFHCCCWLVVSLLRFIYIIHKHWLLTKFPDQKILNRFAVALVFFTYLFCLLIVLSVSMLCGWPRLKSFEMPMPQRAITVGTLLGIYILLVCSSCSFYLLILRKRGRLRNNKVGNNISDMEVQDSYFEIMANQFGNVLIPDSQTIDAYNQDDRRQHSPSVKV